MHGTCVEKNYKGYKLKKWRKFYIFDQNTAENNIKKDDSGNKRAIQETPIDNKRVGCYRVFGRSGNNYFLFALHKRTGGYYAR